MDKETLHRLIAHPTRAGLGKVEKEVARLNGVNEVLRIELGTWKDVVVARNEAIEELNKDIIVLHHQMDMARGNSRESAKHSKTLRRTDALRVEQVRIGVQAVHSCTNDLALRLHDLNAGLEKLKDETCEVRNHIAGNIEIDWMEELSRGTDDTDAK